MDGVDARLTCASLDASMAIERRDDGGEVSMRILYSPFSCAAMAANESRTRVEPRRVGTACPVATVVSRAGAEVDDEATGGAMMIRGGAVLESKGEGSDERHAMRWGGG